MTQNQYKILGLSAPFIPYQIGVITGEKLNFLQEYDFQGPQGPQGPQGDQGPQGPQGDSFVMSNNSIVNEYLSPNCVKSINIVDGSIIESKISSTLMNKIKPSFMKYCICVDGNYPAFESTFLEGFILGEIRLFPDYLLNRKPLNFMPCDGQSLNIHQHQALYSIISNKFGGTEQTFNLPKLN